MEELKTSAFPHGLDYKIVYDTTPFIHESIIEVFKTLRDAIMLVAIVVLVFLQNWRATLIPLIAVPVAIIGTFAVMAAIGFSLNNLSLFGLVLAIGIVVDDAIVVVENVERWLEQGLSPRDAARKAMDEVTGPVVAVALVLCAVFVPCAFITGITGQFFRQFAVTIAVSTVFSAFNSLTLSPALAAILLKPHGTKKDHLDAAARSLSRLVLQAVQRASSTVGTTIYTRHCGHVAAHQRHRPARLRRLALPDLLEFHPGADRLHSRSGQGLSVVERAVARFGFGAAHAGRHATSSRKWPRIRRAWSTPSASPANRCILNANAPNLGSMYVMLKEFERTAADITADEHRRCSCASVAAMRFAKRVVTIFGAPPIDGLGTTGGFKMMIEDRGNLGLAELQKVSDAIVEKANKTPGLQGVFNSSRSDTPWLYLDIDRTKCLALGVPLNNVFDTLQVYLGSYYVNNFNDFGRSWQVNVMADTRFRNRVADIRQLKVPNSKGDMVPLATRAARPRHQPARSC